MGRHSVWSNLKPDVNPGDNLTLLKPWFHVKIKLIYNTSVSCYH